MQAPDDVHASTHTRMHAYGQGLVYTAHMHVPSHTRMHAYGQGLVYTAHMHVPSHTRLHAYGQGLVYTPDDKTSVNAAGVSPEENVVCKCEKVTRLLTYRLTD